MIQIELCRSIAETTFIYIDTGPGQSLGLIQRSQRLILAIETTAPELATLSPQPGFECHFAAIVSLRGQ